MFPILTKIAHQKDEFVASVAASFSAVAALCLFVSFCLMLVAPELVGLVLGAKWRDAAPLMQWLAIFGGFSALVLVLEVPLWVSGKTNLSAAQTWFELAAVLPLTLLVLVCMLIVPFGVPLSLPLPSKLRSSYSPSLCHWNRKEQAISIRTGHEIWPLYVLARSP